MTQKKKFSYIVFSIYLFFLVWLLLFKLSSPLAFALGISDITDIITNTVVTLTGIGAYCLVSAIFKTKTATVVNITVPVLEGLFAGVFLLLVLENL